MPSSRKRYRDFRKSGYLDPRADSSATSSNGQPHKPRDRAATKKYLREYARWLWPYRWALLTVFVIAVATTILDMIWPMAIKGVIDLLPKQIDIATKKHRLNLLGGSIVILLVLKQASDSWRSYLTTVLNAKVIFKLRKRLYEKLLGLPLSALADMKSGGITSRLSGDVDSVSGLVQM